jgi:hypothetical protein
MRSRDVFAVVSICDDWEPDYSSAAQSVRSQIPRQLSYASSPHGALAPRHDIRGALEAEEAAQADAAVLVTKAKAQAVLNSAKAELAISMEEQMGAQMAAQMAAQFISIWRAQSCARSLC